MRERARVGAVGLGPVVLLAALVVACGSKEEPPATPKPLPAGPFALTDYYSPVRTTAGAEELLITSGSSCKQRLPNARGACFRFEEPNEMGWGFIFTYPGFDFGKQPGMTLPSTVTKLHFVAAVTEGSVYKFISPRIGWSYPAPETPYGEDQLSPPQHFDLTTEWQSFEIPLLTSGPMVGNALGAEGYGMMTFYLDDLWFE